MLLSLNQSAQHAYVDFAICTIIVVMVVDCQYAGHMFVSSNYNCDILMPASTLLDLPPLKLCHPHGSACLHR